MGKQNRITLKNHFQTGKVPTQGNYGDLIDSFMNLEAPDIQIIKGGISSSNLDLGGDITASGNISASGYITASELFGNINADYIQMPFNKDVIIGSAGVPYNISASGNFRLEGSASFGGDISASSSVISASKLSAITASISHIEGNSPITLKDPITFQSSSTFTGNIVAGGDLNVAGTVFGTVSSGTGAQTAITSLGTQTLLNVYGPTELSGSLKIQTLNKVGVVSISGSISSSRDISTQGKISASIFTALSASINHITGSISGSITGKVTASGFSLGGTNITSNGAELNLLDGLTNGEMLQVKNIGTNTITSDQWSYVGNANQHVTIGSVPTFTSVTIVSGGQFSIGWDGTETRVNVGDKFKFDITITNFPASRSDILTNEGRIEGRMLVQCSNVNSKSTILANGINGITPHISNVSNGVFYVTFKNYTLEAIDSNALTAFVFTIFKG